MLIVVTKLNTLVNLCHEFSFTLSEQHLNYTKLWVLFNNVTLIIYNNINNVASWQWFYPIEIKIKF